MGRSMNKLEQKIKFVISYFTGHAYYPVYGLPLLCNDFLTKIKMRAYMRFLIEDAIF